MILSGSRACPTLNSPLNGVTHARDSDLDIPPE